MTQRWALAMMLAIALSGCGDDGGDPDASSDASVRDGSADEGVDAARDQRDPNDGSSDGSGDGSSDGASDASRDSASPEVCDGIDNDGDGVVDNVDVAGDGICDCLLIATLGAAGAHGGGDVFGAWLDERSDVGAISLGDQILTAELLNPYQVIVIQDLRGREYSGDEVDVLQDWVARGGGVMTLIGYGPPSERTNVNQLLAPFGLAYDETPILSGSPTVPITGWHTHPVSDMVTQVGVDNGYEVIGDGEIIAEEGGYVMLRGASHAMGKVLVWGDEWITYDSEWTGHPEYQLERFWLNAIKWLTPANECQVPILF